MKYSDYVCVELSCSLIFALLELAFDGREIHRLLYYLLVLWDIQALDIHRL